MRTSNIFGIAYHFIPRDLSNRTTEAEVIRGTSIVTENNVIYIMSGEMPTTDELYEIGTAALFETTYASQIAAKITGLQFTYSYNRQTKERIIRKTPVDAIHFNMLVNGPIGWYAVKLTDVDANTSGEESLFFSDSIGIWSDTERAVIMESLAADATQENIFKDFVLSIQDSLKTELA